MTSIVFARPIRLAAAKEKSQYIKFDELLPCPYNREIDQDKVSKIKQAIADSGEIKPFVVAQVRTDDGLQLMITDGHHRMLAVKELVDELALPVGLKVPFVLSGRAGVESADRAGMMRLAMNSLGAEAAAPIQDKYLYHLPVVKAIEWVIWKNVFERLLVILRTPQEAARLNARTSSLRRALAAGSVQYVDGYVVGNLNATIGTDLKSLGAIFSKQKKGWKIELSKFPQDVRQAIATGEARVAHVKEQVEQQLKVLESGRMKVEPLATLNIEESFSGTVKDLDWQFARTVGDELAVPMETPAHVREELAKGYAENLDLYIRDWEDEAVLRLRKVVSKNVSEGFRAESLEASVRSEWGVSRRKAQFLARQETSLLVSKYRQARYGQAGITTYRWSTSHDERVREDHKILSGRVFDFDSPPITDRATGARNNPGEDFNCRCVAIPIIGRTE